MPSTPFSGVRISWLIVARKTDLASFAAAAACSRSVASARACRSAEREPARLRRAVKIRLPSATAAHATAPIAP